MNGTGASGKMLRWVFCLRDTSKSSPRCFPTIALVTYDPRGVEQTLYDLEFHAKYLQGVTYPFHIIPWNSKEQFRNKILTKIFLKVFEDCA